LCTTAAPLARAGAIRQVASISGAFHGPITAVTPDGSQVTRSANPLISPSAEPSSSSSLSAKERKLRATRGITERTWERSSEPLSRVSTAASSGTRASISSAIRCSTVARSAGGLDPHTANPSRAAPTAASTTPPSPRARSAITRSSIGETSSNRSAEATRSPPIR
jgi:hypothetical protein